MNLSAKAITELSVGYYATINSDRTSLYVVMLDEETREPRIERVTRFQAQQFAEHSMALFVSSYRGIADLTPEIIAGDIAEALGIRARLKPGPPQKTHCFRGHEFTPENTVTRKDRNARTCRACNLASVAKSAAKKKAARG